MGASHSVDEFDYYTSDMWASLHSGFQTNPHGGNQIVSQDGTSANALFPGGASPYGYLPGVDGWLVRTQIQPAF